MKALCNCVVPTGHLDRVVHGITAEEILDACDERTDVAVGDRLSNPTISIAQAVRRHNFATFRNLANQQIKRAQVSRGFIGDRYFQGQGR